MVNIASRGCRSAATYDAGDKESEAASSPIAIQSDERALEFNGSSRSSRGRHALTSQIAGLRTEQDPSLRFPSHTS